MPAAADSTKRIKGGARLALRMALLVAYGAFIAQCIDAQYAATQADERQLNGMVVDWFGHAWLVALAINVVVIVVLHILLRRTHSGVQSAKRSPADGVS